MKTGRIAAAVLAMGLFAINASASDPPHWASATSSTDCTNPCHVAHNASGGNLTGSASNVNLCQSCHNSGGTAKKMAIENSDKANVGYKGTSHAFDVAAINATYGAGTPSNTTISKKLISGNVVCSTCHDQHAANGSGTAAGTFGGTPHVSAAQWVANLGGTGSVTAGGVYTGANGSWYLVEIYGTGGTPGVAQFHYSKDNGSTWFPAVPGVILTSSSAVTLDNGVTAAFAAGNYVIGERWQFYGAFPFLRAPADKGDNTTGSKFCRDCHSSWVMDHNGVNLYDGNVKSHPVGIPLNANAGGYDRPTPLDGNGLPQSTGDGNAFNDMNVDASGDVQCLTCHAVHFAPSNTSATGQAP